jgi:ferredoxin
VRHSKRKFISHGAPQKEKIEKMSKKVRIDEEECIGCGNCEELCPEIFKLHKDREKSEVIKPEGGSQACIEEAMEACPVSCIYWD